MRVSRGRLREDERGAVVMVVAIVLVVVIGMLVLVVDLGRGVAYKRQVVTGTDERGHCEPREHGGLLRLPRPVYELQQRGHGVGELIRYGESRRPVNARCF